MEMIQINKTAISGETINTVNARELHTFLGVGKDFSNWMKDRVDAYGFVENVDYLVLTPKLANTSGRPSKEYHVSLDMAKELSMVDRGVKGKEVRKYFIECEKRANNPIAMLDDPTTLRNMLLGYTEKVIKLEQAVKEQKVVIQQQAPAVAFHNTVAAHEDLWYSLEESAKLLNVGRTTLSRFLKDNGYMTQTRFPLQRYIDSKIMGVKIDQYKEPVGYGQFVEHAPTAKPFLTGKGLTVIGEKLRKAGM